MNDDQPDDPIADLNGLRAELERLRNHFDEELERQKLDALAEFAAGAGHEINNPLAIIGGHAQILLREIENTEQRRQLAVIVAQVKRAYEMIADIRFFARPPAPEKTVYDIVADLEKILQEQESLMREQSVTFHFDADFRDSSDARPLQQSLFVETDAVLLHTAVVFLCNNARETLRPNGGTVRLTLRRRETNGLEISVEDDGIGIEESIRPLIFCPYYSERQAGRGLGFGLPKTWRIMQRLGGSVRCEQPESGQGTRFILYLPDVVVGHD